LFQAWQEGRAGDGRRQVNTIHFKETTPMKNTREKTLEKQIGKPAEVKAESKSNEAVGKDAFGYRLDTNRAKACAVLTADLQTKEEVKARGMLDGEGKVKTLFRELRERGLLEKKTGYRLTKKGLALQQANHDREARQRESH